MNSATAEAAVCPAFRSLPGATSSEAGRDAVELAAQAGLFLDPWQAAFLVDALGERDDGKWAALEVGLIVPRQNGKGSILEARELAGLFLFGERLIVHTAHEFKTAADQFRRIRELIESTPSFDSEVFKILANNNDMSIELKSRQRLRFVARTAGSGRGFSADCVILDKAYNLSGDVMAALVPTLSARPNPQMWYTSSAPFQTPPSEVLRRFCRRGRTGAARVVYSEYCADKDDDQGSREAVAKANPSLGIRLDEEVVESERGSLLDEFARERLGIWDDTEDAGSIISTAQWLACEDRKSGPGGELSFALDVSKTRSVAAFAVAGESARGGTHIELVDYRPGTDWLVERARELQDRWDGALAVAGGSPAATRLPELEQAGVNVTVIASGEHAQACGAFYDAVTQCDIKHLGQVELAAAVQGADRKFSGDSWLWSRRTSMTEISPLVAVTLAFWVARQNAKEVVPFF